MSAPERHPCPLCEGIGTQPLQGAGRGIEVVCERCLGTGWRAGRRKRDCPDVVVHITLSADSDDRTLATVRVQGTHEYGIQRVHPTRRAAKAWVLDAVREEVSDVG